MDSLGATRFLSTNYFGAVDIKYFGGFYQPIILVFNVNQLFWWFLSTNDSNYFCAVDYSCYGGDHHEDHGVGRIHVVCKEVCHNL